MTQYFHFGSLPPTVWERVRIAQDPSHPQRQDALDQLLRDYWRPVFYFLRRRGASHERAEDLTQQFFLELISRDWLAPAAQERGRLRSLMYTMVSRFWSDQGAGRATRKQVFERKLIPVSSLMNDADRAFEPSQSLSPEAVFMQRWALAVFDQARRCLARWCEERKQREKWLAVFDACHRASDEQEPGPTQEELARRLGLTRNQVRYALAQTEARFAICVREVLAQQTGSPQEVDDELRQWKHWLSRG